MNNLFLHSWVDDMSQTLFLRPQQFPRGKDISLGNPGKPRGVPLNIFEIFVFARIPNST